MSVCSVHETLQRHSNITEPHKREEPTYYPRSGSLDVVADTAEASRANVARGPNELQLMTPFSYQSAQVSNACNLPSKSSLVTQSGQVDSGQADSGQGQYDQLSQQLVSNAHHDVQSKLSSSDADASAARVSDALATLAEELPGLRQSGSASQPAVFVTGRLDQDIAHMLWRKTQKPINLLKQSISSYPQQSEEADSSGEQWSVGQDQMPEAGDHMLAVQGSTLGLEGSLHGAEGNSYIAETAAEQPAATDSVSRTGANGTSDLRLPDELLVEQANEWAGRCSFVCLNFQMHDCRVSSLTHALDACLQAAHIGPATAAWLGVGQVLFAPVSSADSKHNSQLYLDMQDAHCPAMCTQDLACPDRQDLLQSPTSYMLCAAHKQPSGSRLIDETRNAVWSTTAAAQDCSAYAVSASQSCDSPSDLQPVMTQTLSSL